ncbi:hypothetical protein [Streptomyces albipurpureus]|uniref:Uncharacterized protein n=1 Tax=Streptomyces albipurpureus TaxID=2897419 RepID=A0ABT0UVY6_9ACTN|nr:hypothetical protein [Streptomyces sp. CWNU-1]MCM2391346.1 hypothetical protein [Streptomyces sp. CWNU-1]
MDFTVLAHAVEVDHGVKRVSMRFIKKYAAPTRMRLSSELNAEITKALAEHGLVTLPRTLPTSEDAFIFVLQADTVLGEAANLSVMIFAGQKIGMLADLPIETRFPRLAEETK